MSIALGWLAILVSFSGAPVPRVDGPSITYQFQVIELQGLQWREGAVPGLRPVSSRGGVTVWTAPADFLDRLPASSSKQLVMAPKVTALSQTPAHITSRKGHPLVTQVSWRGQNAAPRETTETIREGFAATVSGRAIDQGVLVQLVIEDTEVRSIHTVCSPDPSQPRVAFSEVTLTPACEDVIGVGSAIITVQGTLTGTCTATARKTEMPNSCEAFCPASGTPSRVDIAVRTASVTGTSCTRIAESCCAEEAADAPCCKSEEECCSAGQKQRWTASQARTVQVQIPEIGRAEISGEWLIPRDEVLLVGFGPHTVADKDGKAVVRERLAMITASEIALPAASVDAEPLGLPRPAVNVARPPVSLLPKPALPSRTLPQGVNTDGSPADLPPLPDDAAESSADESAEPLASPQKHKDRDKDKEKTASPAGSGDSQAAKTGFTLPGNLFKQLTTTGPASISLPNLQFTMPLKAFEVPLPFNQKLQLEVIGRVTGDGESVVK